MSGERPDVRLDGRDGRDVVTELLERMPDQLRLALAGDRDALADLLLAAVEADRQSRLAVLGSVESVATGAHAVAEAIADCYTEGRTPSDLLCDQAFSLADRVDALADEVRLRRRADGDLPDLAPPENERVEVRYQARAHLVAMREAAQQQRRITNPDVWAAEHLYELIVEHTRRGTAEAVARAIATPPSGGTIADIKANARQRPPDKRQ